MLDKLAAIEEKFEQINAQLFDPDVISDIDKYKKLMQESKHLTPVVEKYREYKTAQKNYDEAKSLIDGGGLDRDFRDMALEEMEESSAIIEKTKEELKILLLPRDPNDDKNVIVEIRGGAGGEESALFANSLFRMYSMYAEARGWKPDILSANPTELGGYKEISFMIEGDGAYSRFKFESGVHRVQRVPETESQGRIHTSTVTVAVLPEAQEVDIDINPVDLQIDTFRSSGAGGQHINKTDSAIRIIGRDPDVVDNPLHPAVDVVGGREEIVEGRYMVVDDVMLVEIKLNQIPHVHPLVTSLYATNSWAVALFLTIFTTRPSSMGP